jgi:hypothetical protein
VIRWNTRQMPRVTPDQMAAAISSQMKLATSEALYARCDELAVLQKVMFMELVSFARDGATDDQITELIGFLSVMQYLAEDISKGVARPVKMPEFRDSVKRAIFWFKTFDSDDPANQKQMIGSWLESMEQQGEPVIWAWVTNMFKKHGILTCSLAEGMVITIWAVADVFSRRFAKVK